MPASLILLDLIILEIFHEYCMIALMICISAVNTLVIYYVINAQYSDNFKIKSVTISLLLCSHVY
jgi:hypothetical protein